MTQLRLTGSLECVRRFAGPPAVQMRFVVQGVTLAQAIYSASLCICYLRKREVDVFSQLGLLQALSPANPTRTSLDILSGMAAELQSMCSSPPFRAEHQSYTSHKPQSLQAVLLSQMIPCGSPGWLSSRRRRHHASAISKLRRHRYRLLNWPLQVLPLRAATARIRTASGQFRSHCLAALSGAPRIPSSFASPGSHLQLHRGVPPQEQRLCRLPLPGRDRSPKNPTLHDDSTSCRCQRRQREWAKTAKKFL